MLAGANLYTGPTLIAQGTLKAGAQNTLPTTSDLNFSSSVATTPGTTAGTLDLSDNGITVRNLNVFTDSATEVNQILIGAGETLQVTGTFVVGPNSTTANTTTKLTVSGAGTFQVETPTTPTNTNVKVDGNLTSGRGNAATLDMSALENFLANLGTGVFFVGDTADGALGASTNSTLIFAKNSTINASTYTQDNQHGTVTVELGTGVNTFNVNTMDIGSVNRGNGSFGFAASNTTGTLKIRALDTVSRAAMTVGYGPSGTGATLSETVDPNGHASDLLLSTLGIGGRTSTAGNITTATFRFNSGTLDATEVVVGDRRVTAANASSTTGTLELGGGNVTIGSGGLLIANNASTLGANPVIGTVAVSGNTVMTVGQTAGTSITLGRSTTSGVAATATLNITGGSVTLAGDLVEGTGAGNAAVVSTLTLNGGTLDLGGNDIGSGAAAINNLNFQSGTLRSVASINGTGGLTKTTGGTLIMEGTNAYTGATNVNAGTLLVNGSINGSLLVSVNNTGTLGGGIGVLPGSTGSTEINSGGTLAPGNAPGTTGILTTAGNLSFQDGSSFKLEINGTTAGSGYDQQVVTGNTLISGTGTTLTLGGSYVGPGGDIFTTILNSGTMTTGSGFANAAQGAIIAAGNGQMYQISYFDDASTPGFELAGGNDVSLLAVVPEPNALAMLVGSLGMALGLQRFRRRRES